MSNHTFTIKDMKEDFLSLKFEFDHCIKNSNHTQFHFKSKESHGFIAIFADYGKLFDTMSNSDYNAFDLYIVDINQYKNRINKPTIYRVKTKNTYKSFKMCFYELISDNEEQDLEIQAYLFCW